MRTDDDDGDDDEWRKVEFPARQTACAIDPVIKQITNKFDNMCILLPPMQTNKTSWHIWGPPEEIRATHSNHSNHAQLHKCACLRTTEGQQCVFLTACPEVSATEALEIVWWLLTFNAEVPNWA